MNFFCETGKATRFFVAPFFSKFCWLESEDLKAVEAINKKHLISIFFSPFNFFHRAEMWMVIHLLLFSFLSLNSLLYCCSGKKRRERVRKENWSKKEGRRKEKL